MKRIAYLDGIRGLAALIVIFHHYGLAFYIATFSGNPAESQFAGVQFDTIIGHSPLGVFFNGNFAVCIFFVLSGIVLSNGFFTTKKTELLPAMAVKRYFRLTIPILSSVILSFILIKLSLMYNLEALQVVKKSWWLHDMYNAPDNYHFTDIFNEGLLKIQLLGSAKYNTVYWTMAEEIYGSFLVFATLALTYKIRKRYLCYVLLIIALLYIWEYFCVCFVAGVWISDVLAHKQFNPSGRNKIVFVLLLLSGLFLGSYPSADKFMGPVYEYLKLSGDRQSFVIYHCLGAILVVGSICYLPSLQKILSLKPFQFLGYISFSTYLIHALVLGSFSCWLFVKVYPIINYHVTFAVVFSISLCIIIIASYFMAKYVDDKGIKFSRYIYKRYFAPNEAGQNQ